MKCKLEDICTYRKEKIAVSKLNLSTYVSTENMRPNKGGITEASTSPSSLTAQMFHKGDVLVSNIRPYFKKIWRATYSGGCSNDVLVFTPKEGTDSAFLYYVLSEDAFFSYATATSKGTKMPRGDKAAIMQYQVPFYDVVTQKRIAAILSSLDDKIELNNKINANLEQQAQALFKAWFVDFEPFGGKMPTDWRVKSLTDIADYRNGLAMQRFRPRGDDTGFPVLKIRELRQGRSDSESERCTSAIATDYLVNDGDVVFSWSGSLLVDIWSGGACGLNQHLFKVTSTRYEKWFYYSWTKHHLAHFIALAADRATTMGHIKRSALEQAKVLIPNERDYRKLGEMMAPLYDTITSNRVENRHLSALRDMLLQRLMSGAMA